MKISASVTRSLFVLCVFVFSSPAFSVMPKPETEKAQQNIADYQYPAASIASKGTGTVHSFGVRIAGTYLVIRQPEKGTTRILNLFADGNLTGMQSVQFGGGDPREGFSNQHGTWKRIGKHMIEATVLDLEYDPSTGEFLGTTITHYTLKFDKDLQNIIEGIAKGKIYGPGVDPLNPGDNIPFFTFSDTFQAQRVPVGN